MNLKCGAFVWIIVILLELINGAVASDDKMIFCYYGTWSYYRTGNGKFTPSNINAQKCTHLGYSFFGINDSGELKVLDPWLDLDSGLGNIAKTIALKKQNPHLKVLAVVGGWNEGSAKYSSLAGDTNKRQRFVQSAIQFMQQHGFDGLDLDWEYPGQRGGNTADRSNFVILLQELKQAFKPLNLLLGIAVAATSASAGISYDIPNISKHVDYINVMTYDFKGPWDTVLGHNTALDTVQSSIQYWLQAGAPPQKLLMGLAIYGHTFTMANSAQTSTGSPSTGPGTAGPYTREGGVLSYAEICEKFHDTSSNSWTKVWDNTYSVPYAFQQQQSQWLSYDNEQSIKLKIDYVKGQRLRGVMLWSLEQDDVHAYCGANTLLDLINAELLSSANSNSSTTTSTTATTTTSRSTTASSVVCTENGSYAHPSDCSGFYKCIDGVRYDFDCPNGLVYDAVNGVCNWPALVDCNKKTVKYTENIYVVNKNSAPSEYDIEIVVLEDN